MIVIPSSKTFSFILLALGLSTALGCSGGDPAERMRAMAEKLKNAPTVEQLAAQQKVSPDVVKQVQQDLTTIYEYMGPVTGELDMVTINAIQAFQRSQNLRPDGMLNDRTIQALSSVAAHKAKG